MIVLGDANSGKSSLIRALANIYITDKSKAITNAVDVYKLNFGDQQIRIWEFASERFYIPFQRSLVQEGMFAMIVINNDHPEAAEESIAYWQGICKYFGISDWIIVFSKADQADQRDFTQNIRATIPGSYFISSKCDSPELQRLRIDITNKMSMSTLIPVENYETQLIKVVKILTMIDQWGVSEIQTVAETFDIKNNYLKYGIFLPDDIIKLMNEYTIFLFRYDTVQRLSSNFECQMCSIEPIFDPKGFGQCINPHHNVPKANVDLDVNMDNILVREFNPPEGLFNGLISELINRKVLYKVILENGLYGYFFPRLFENGRLPKKPVNPIRISYSDPEIPNPVLVNQILQSILDKYQLIWTSDTMFGSYGGRARYQFYIEHENNIWQVKLFEHRTYVDMELPPFIDPNEFGI